MKLDEVKRLGIRQEILSKINSMLDRKDFEVTMKADKSPVTELDIFISDLVKKNLDLDGKCFLSEEDQESFGFPGYILDPIDGTRELTLGIGECCMSLAFIDESKKKGWAWIYNPFTGFELTSDMGFVRPQKANQEKLLGLVSSGEWSKGLYPKKDYPGLVLAPRGSIAYKLGLMASGACDFVVTKNPKNIWDIAGGTLLLWQRGFKCFQNNEMLTELSKIHYNTNLVWCKEEHRDIIFENLGL